MGMFEKKHEPLLPFRLFVIRLVRSAGLAIVVVASALLMGVLGYHYVASFGWIDSLLNASMILAGMGPVGTLPSAAAKVFASLYALFSGIAFLAVAGILVAPVAHRVLHWFHADPNMNP
ncbi:MAG: hypothetical protein ACYDBQ_11800 [Thermoplasmatota archaeon]